MTKQYIQPKIQIASVVSMTMMQSSGSTPQNTMDVSTSLTDDQW